MESITFPPALIRAITETPVGESWLEAVPELEQILANVEARKSRVKAAADAVKIGEALRITVRPDTNCSLSNLACFFDFLQADFSFCF